MATWQELLEQYKTDPNAAAAEILRAKQVYEGEKAGYGAGFDESDRAKQITDWINMVNQASGNNAPQAGALIPSGVAGAIGGTTTAAASNTPAAVLGTASQNNNTIVPTTTDTTNTTNTTTTTPKATTQTVAALQNANTVSALTPTSATQTASVIPTATYQSADIQKMINDLKQAQINASIANLGKAKENSLSAYAGAEDKINQAAQAQKNTNSIASQKGALDFAKYLATRGLINSGTAAQGEISRNVALQGAQSAVDTSRLSQLADVANARAGIESGYQSDLAAAQAGAETNALQLAIQEAQRQDTANREQAYQNALLRLQEAGITGTYNNAPTLAAQQFNTETALQEASLTGIYKGNQTLAAQQQALDNAFRQGQFDWNKQQALWERGFQTGQFDYQKARDAVADKQWGKEYQQQLDEWAWSKNTENPYVRAQILQNQAQEMSNEMMQLDLTNYPETARLRMNQLTKEIAQIGASPALTTEEQELQKVKLQTAQEELKQIQNNPASIVESVAQSLITNGNTGSAFTYIKNSDIDQSIKDRLLLQYGYDAYIQKALDKAITDIEDTSVPKDVTKEKYRQQAYDTITGRMYNDDPEIDDFITNALLEKYGLTDLKPAE